MNTNTLSSVPWINKSEFVEVYELIISETSEDWKTAYNHLKAWKTRFQREAPVAIECTEMLLKAELALRELDPRDDDERGVKLLCSMAIIRFMNLMAGRMANIKNVSYKTGPLSMYVEAGKIGIADWLVGLRHTLIHREMASLAIIRPAVSWAFHWIKREFWELQHREYNETTITPNLQTHECSAVLKSYHASKLKTKELNDIISNLKSAICHYIVQKDYLIPQKKLLLRLDISPADILECRKIPELPKQLTSYWSDLFDALGYHKLIGSLLRLLLREMSCDQSERSYYISGWCEFIISQRLLKHANGEPNYDFAWNEVFNVCVNQPNSFTKAILTNIFPLMRPQLTEEKQMELVSLVDVFLESASSPADTPRCDDSVAEDGSADAVYTASDVSHKDLEVQPESKWQKAHDVDWETCAFGILPGQVIDSLTLSKTEGKKRHVPFRENSDLDTTVKRQRTDSGEENVCGESDQGSQVQGLQTCGIMDVTGDLPTSDLTVKTHLSDHAWTQAHITSIAANITLFL